MALFSFNNELIGAVVLVVVVVLAVFGVTNQMLMYVSGGLAAALVMYALVLMGKGKVEGFVGSSEYTDL